MTELIYYKNCIQNQFINKIIKKELDFPFIFYQPYIIDKEILYTNIILKKILQEKYFEWCNQKIITNSFGEAQYYNNNKFNFEKIPICKTGCSNISINEIQKDTFPYKNIAITNIWLVINNSNNLKLNNIIDKIRFVYGGMLFQNYSTNDIENEINILAYIFNVDGIKYKNNKIYIPLIIPYNSFILNNNNHNTKIILEKENQPIENDFEAWGNICNTNVFPQLEKTNNFTHNCNFIFYKTQFNGDELLQLTNNKIKIYFDSPVYVLYIMNISKDYVKSIKLFIDSYENENLNYNEYKLNDIEWFDNHVIIWINRNFLLLNELDNCINFSKCRDPYLIIENTYSKDTCIQIIAVSFQILNHCNGFAKLKYCS